jgi:hypothetical protein
MMTQNHYKQIVGNALVFFLTMSFLLFLQKCHTTGQYLKCDSINDL